GHVKHRHMLYYLGFLFISLVVLASGWEAIGPKPGPGAANQYWIPPLMVGSLGAYIFVVFGFLSRRCERQADIFGCRAVTCGRPDCIGHDETTLPRGSREAEVLESIQPASPASIQSADLAPRAVRSFPEVIVTGGLSDGRPGLCPTGIRTFIHALEKV